MALPLEFDRSGIDNGERRTPFSVVEPIQPEVVEPAVSGTIVELFRRPAAPDTTPLPISPDDSPSKDGKPQVHVEPFNPDPLPGEREMRIEYSDGRVVTYVSRPRTLPVFDINTLLKK